MPDAQRQFHRGRLAQAGRSRRTEKRRKREKYLLFQTKLDSVQYERLFRGPHLLMRTGAVLWVALRKMTDSSNVAENRQGDPLTDVDFAKQQFGIKLTFS